MQFLNRLLIPLHHCEDAASYLLKQLNVKFTQTHLRKELLGHPDYPSMLSIGDVLGMSYDIGCKPLAYKSEQILWEPDIAPPFMVHLKGKPGQPNVFGVVTKFSEESIELYNPNTKKLEQLSFEGFDEIYNGYVLAVEKGNDFIEKGFEKNQKKEKYQNVFNTLVIFFLPTLVSIICIMYALNNTAGKAIAPILFIILTLIGCSVAVLLLWHEIDEYNPVVKQVCQARAKINCSAVLNSSASKIFGLSWSSIGFIYFAGILLSLIADNMSVEMLILTSWFNVLALPYIFFSIYYQWKIAKQWCLLCLMIQALLLLQFVSAIAGGFHTLGAIHQLSINSYMNVVSSFSIIAIATTLIIPTLKKVKENRSKTIELQRLKHNPQIFEALLGKQKVMEQSSDGLGIILGNPQGIYKLVKVCNPYCGPCASAHPIMEELAENNEEVCLQIIFTATNDNKDIKKAPTAHLLAIANKDNVTLTKKALHDWYSHPAKDYTDFAKKYPLNNELELQSNKIEQMSEWCQKVGIVATPTFFVCLNAQNNEKAVKFYQLPDMYTVNDLKHFLTI